MGKFIYSDQVKVEYEDRLLAHLQIVMGNKLRRGEPFYFSWKEEQSTGGGRTSVWMHAGASFVFKFSGGRAPAINRTWLEALMYTASSVTGLHVVPEPPEQAPDPNGMLT